MATALESASLAMIPSGYEEGTLGSLQPLDGSGDFTFSRGSNLAATRVNQDGLIEKGYENLLLHSNSFDTTWIARDATITSGQSGYDGSNDAWLLEATSNGYNRRVYQSVSLSSVFTLSFYAKANTSNYAQAIVFNSTGADPKTYFNLSTGETEITTDSIDANMVDVGGGWYKCSITGNALVTQIWLLVSDFGYTNLVDAGGSIYIQDAQLNQGLVAYPYLETTTTSAKGGILENTPRIDYTGGGAGSLLLEPSRTNFIRNSEYIVGESRSVITYNQAISPEGVNNAILGLDTTTPGDSQVGPTIVTAPSGTSTMVFSIFAKKYNNRYIYLRIDDNPANIDGTVNLSWATFDLEDGVVTSEGTYGSPANPFNGIEDYGNGWFRCWVGVTKRSGVTRTDARVYLVGGPDNPNQNPKPPGTGVNGNYLYGYQCEEGAYPTSHIPTYGVSQTRLPDISGVSDSAALIGQDEGSYFIEWTHQLSDGFYNIAGLTSGGSNRIQVQLNTAGGLNSRMGFICIVNGVNLYNSSAIQNLIVGEDYKFAVTYTQTSLSAYLNGTQIINRTGFSASGGVFSSFDFQYSSYKFGQAVKKALLFDTPLSNEKLQELTTI